MSTGKLYFTARRTMGAQKKPHIFIVKVKRDARQTEEEVTPNVQRSEV